MYMHFDGIFSSRIFLTLEERRNDHSMQWIATGLHVILMCTVYMYTMPNYANLQKGVNEECTHTHMSYFSSNFSGGPVLASCPFDFLVINTLVITYISCHNILLSACHMNVWKNVKRHWVFLPQYVHVTHASNVPVLSYEDLLTPCACCCSINVRCFLFLARHHVD